ncbi:hypothetical protein D3C76_1632360 [compost metagenome]
MSQSNNSPWPLVTLCAVINLISLAMILIGPETRGIDLNAVAAPDADTTSAPALLSK